MANYVKRARFPCGHMVRDRDVTCGTCRQEYERRMQTVRLHFGMRLNAPALGAWLKGRFEETGDYDNGGLEVE